MRSINGYEIHAGADLRHANLSGANLSGVDLRHANLSGANLSGASLDSASLRHANLSGVDLSGVDLSSANLSSANLSGVDLSGADLRHANLSGVDLSGVDLSGANLSSANLSSAKGLLNSADWLKANFKTNKKGFIVFKAEGVTTYPAPTRWKSAKFITEVVNPCRSVSCGCGVNFATKEWIRNFYGGGIKIRRMYLHWEDLADVVVPYNTNGKARCARLEKGRLI